MEKKNMVLCAYEYLFYKVYAFMKWPEFENTNLHYSAYLGMAVLCAESLVSLIMLLQYLIKSSGLLLFLPSVMCLYILTFVFFITVNYFFFLYKKKYKKIFQYYDKKDKVIGKKGDIFAWSFIFFSLFSLPFGMLLKIIVETILELLK